MYALARLPFRLDLQKGKAIPYESLKKALYLQIAIR